MPLRALLDFLLYVSCISFFLNTQVIEYKPSLSWVSWKLCITWRLELFKKKWSVSTMSKLYSAVTPAVLLVWLDSWCALADACFTRFSLLFSQPHFSACCQFPFVLTGSKTSIDAQHSGALVSASWSLCVQDNSSVSALGGCAQDTEPLLGLTGTACFTSVFCGSKDTWTQKRKLIVMVIKIVALDIK